MPTISYFYGIFIRMYVKDHPPPHFHVIYAEHEAKVRIADGEVFEGSLPRNAARIVKEWAGLRRDALMENWQRARRNRPLEKVPGLDAVEGQ
jgi:hypothetical protein